MASTSYNDQFSANSGTRKREDVIQYRDPNNGKTRWREDSRRPVYPSNRKRYGHKNDYRKGGCIDIEYLDDVLKLNDEEFVLNISANMRGLNELLNENNLSNDTYVLVIRVLRKIFTSRFPKSQVLLSQTILKEQFVQRLQKYLGSLPMHDENQKSQNKFFWQNTDAFWTDLIEVSRKALEMLPNYASSILPKVVSSIQICIPLFEQHQYQEISDEIKSKLDELGRALKVTRSRYEEEKAVDVKEQMIPENDDPPDDFREISVYPDASEILNDRTFLRPNVIHGPYRSVDHYLDVQFRLLREDFVSPLRSGVQSVRTGQNTRHENVRVHRRIRFLYQEIVNEYHCVRIKFNFSEKVQNFTYENSKKFMYGTLLCFTRDEFKTLKFARVVKRDKEDLERGELVVGFDKPALDLSFAHDYLMIECSVYFEPYLHVLTAFKNIYKNDFAMAQYIVNVQTTVAKPKYLDKHDIFAMDGYKLYIKDLMTSAYNRYGFNDSQMDAYKAALTREFAIIQGPPGTGKTFLGLKIAETLLSHQDAWWKSTPMLVICFTNHALDQFLEGVLRTTRKIARIGGQSKNENLNQFNIINLRKRAPDNNTYISWSTVKDALHHLGSLASEIKMIEQCESIIPFKNIYDIVPDFDVTYFWTDDPFSFEKWLLGDHYLSSVSQYRAFQTSEARNMGIDDGGGGANQDKNDENIANDDQNPDSINRSFVEMAITDMEFNASESMFSLNGFTQIIREYKCLLYAIESKPKVVDGTSSRLKISFEETQTLKKMIAESEDQYNHLKRRLDEVRDALRNQRIRTDIKTNDLASLNYDERWALYTFWLNHYKQHLRNKEGEATQEFRALYKQYEEVQNIEDTRLLRQQLVVGMTTTSAARLRTVLEGLRSPIVIVEEAAEVLEAHIITALTKHCQHLILIGDHKQLKPSSADYNITKEYNLGVSLFERMVNNGIQCHTLNIQHRMRPEISRLISPSIYPDLKDHESVFNRPPIAGIDTCIQFIDHTNPEDDCGDNPTKKNMHEVQFALALARHLILNGYKSEQVTILAAYQGQMFAMFKERDNFGTILKKVRIVALDNYQGEESDIIILSLVRSNTIRKIGFLATENRVCVALSRAKNGFYMIGDMELLSSVSKLWSGIKKILITQNAIGPDLVLRCQIHKHVTTLVRNAEDFLQVPEGGCDQICGAILVCGHFCQSICHIENRDHKNFQCLERCNEKLCDQDEKHICRKMCYEECGPCTYGILRKLDCGHELAIACHIDLDTYKCPVLVKTRLSCGHDADKPCHVSANAFPCPKPCDVLVEPCGHSCTQRCHIHVDPDHIKYKCQKQCARPRKGCTVEPESSQHECLRLCYQLCSPCDIPMKKQRTKCEHINIVACNVDVDSIECTKPCTRQLSCGHKCKNLCGQPCDAFSCRIKVKKILDLCKHEITMPCCMEPTRKLCDKKCPLKLPCGHNCTQRCNQVCTSWCEVLVDCQIEAACGHVIVKMKCADSTSGLMMNDKKLLENCTHPCNIKLKCGHECSGTCGECMQGRFHKRCGQKCGVPLVCNHECEFPCREACRPCNKPCPYRCLHSVCKKKCGEVCTPCMEPCERKCRHQKCSRRCGVICNVPPCNEPCPKILKCGHPCIGFCGDYPCPPKCLICDREELLETEMLFGYENENSRFIWLIDCKHVIESEGMEQWMKMGDNSSEIGIKVCPKCKTPIKRTLRYSDYIKNAIADVNKVKLKAIGVSTETLKIQRNLSDKIEELYDDCKSPTWRSYVSELRSRLTSVRDGRRQIMNQMQLTAIESKMQVLKQVIEIGNESPGLEPCKYQQGIRDVLERDFYSFTIQEIADVVRELPRVFRSAQYGSLKLHPLFTHSSITNPEVKKLTENIEASLFRLGAYSDDENIKSWLEELKKILGSRQPLNDVEKREIVAAMGMARGHWYKCPNGHIYTIGNCGGAVETSVCNECRATIGGTRHTLAKGNTAVSVIHGASTDPYGRSRSYF